MPKKFFVLFLCQTHKSGMRRCAHSRQLHQVITLVALRKRHQLHHHHKRLICASGNRLQQSQHGEGGDVLAKDGVMLYACGAGTDGQLGNGDTLPRLHPTRALEPPHSASGSRITALACADNSTLLALAPQNSTSCTLIPATLTCERAGVWRWPVKGMVKVVCRNCISNQHSALLPWHSQQ